MKLQEALGLIPDSNIAQRALELAVENSLNKDVPDCATALESGFLFPVTSEGAAYWRSVVDALRSGNDIPPLPFIASWHDKKTEGSSLAEGARALDERTRVYSDTASLPPFPPAPPAELPPYPEAPEGKMWEYVGEAVHGLLGRGMWASCNPRGPAPSWYVVNNGLRSSGGYRDHHYIKLVDAPTQCASQCAETCAPNPESGDIVQENAQTLPYPPVPAGYDRWAYRGFGYDSGGVDVWCAICYPNREWYVWVGPTRATGNTQCIYLEAVKDAPLQLRVGGYYRQRGGSTCCITTEREGATYRFSDDDGYGYTISGRYIGDHVSHDLDIIEEVPAPVLQLRVGGYYRQRGGRVCHIVIESEEDVNYCFADEFGEGFTSSGSYISEDSPDDLDIIEEITQEQYNQERN